jgi:group II intron reverse transcriptase/maturase
MWNLETGYNHIYDCDIKGFFDNIPHKKLMKILNKYISDGTVLDMIWHWLKAGYMEEGKYHETNSGTPQGGVISPILSNIYLNELDWRLEAEGIRFVRYADDFLLFAKTDAEIRRAGQIANEIIESLGLEVSMEKTRYVDFNNEDFKFIGYQFEHWRDYKKQEGRYFIIKPTDASLKDFKENKAVQANEKYGQKSRCYLKAFSQDLHKIDSYTRQRLRVAMIHKHPTQRKGWGRTVCWGIEFFCKIGLIPSNWLYYNKMYGYTIEKYVERQTSKNKAKHQKHVAKLKEKGLEYYTPDRLEKIRYSFSF